MVGRKLSRLVVLASLVLLVLFLFTWSLNFTYESQSESSSIQCSESSPYRKGENFVRTGQGASGKRTVLNPRVRDTTLNCPSAEDPIILLVHAGSPIYHNREESLKSWKSCPYKCCFTQDGDEFIDVADLVAFPTFWLPKVSRLPFVNQSSILKWQESKKKQIWVGVAMESPYNVGKHGKEVDGVFHWMASYRPDSDVRFRYGTFQRIDSNSVITEGFLHTWEYQNLFVEPAPQSHPPPTFQKPKEKKMVAWLVSHCGSWSRRALLVKSLQKYLDVDIYGECGPFDCPDDDAHCRDFLAANYKFYLAFENSLCLDYVTEKLWSVLGKDILPVTFSWINDTAAFPPRSYINALDFGSVQELAKYMIYLNDNEDQYQSYFQWKKEYRVFDGGDGLCSMCEKVWQRRQGNGNSEEVHADRYESMLRWMNTLSTSTKNDDGNGYGTVEFRVGNKRITTNTTCIDPFDHKILLDWMQDIKSVN